MAEAVIKKCSCKNDYQDKNYGKDMRLWNPTTKGYRCSVCGTQVNESGGKK